MLRLAAAGVLLLGAAAFTAERKASLSDCRYSLEASRFANRGAREREVLARAAWLGSAAATGARAAPKPASEIAQRNFIDREIFGRLIREGIPSAAVSSDEEFFRRIHLDLTGRLPEPNAIREFLSDKSDSKRDLVVDALLDSPEFVDRWTLWMGDWLQNTTRLANAAVNRNAQGRNAFHAYIRAAVAEDRPLRRVAIETVAGSGNNYEAESGAANFPLGASTSMGPVQDTYDTMLVRTASTFLGLGAYDCLLCHNGRGHLNPISSWGTQQTRAQALFMAAFFSRMTFTAAPGNSMQVSDNSARGYELNTDSGNRPAREPVAGMNALTPLYRETGATPGGDNWRQSFAENMVRDPMFARNIANRIWKQIFGLPLADPVDGLDPARLDPAAPPPAPWDFQASHPQLLEALAAELGRVEFRLRPFLRTLVQSSAYQLSSRYSAGAEASPMYARHYARRLEGEEVHDAIAKATGVPGSYAIQGWADRVAWAVQLPEPVEPAGNAAVNNFMNTFLRGNRDTQDRSQSGSIQQQLVLMNDPFVAARTKVAASPRLQGISRMASDAALLEEMYLAFLSRLPGAREVASGTAFLSAAGSGEARIRAIEDLAWMCINKVEFVFSY